MEIIKREREKIDVQTMSPLIWAYIGDAVYELYVRTQLINTTNLKPHRLHVESIKYVKAQAQAEILKSLQDILTEEEKEIVRRTRNTKNHHLPKNANLEEYTYSTAFEGLIGYLYLTKQDERLQEIMENIKINGKIIDF